jgi:hypothetical protein
MLSWNCGPKADEYYENKATRARVKILTVGDGKHLYSIFKVQDDPKSDLREVTRYFAGDSLNECVAYFEYNPVYNEAGVTIKSVKSFLIDFSKVD